MKKTFLILSVLIFSSCSLIHFLSVNDKKPESRKEYQAYLLANGYDTINSFQLLRNYYDSIHTLPYTLNLYKLKYNTKASPIQIRVYDSTGKFINGYEQCFGELRKTHILDSFPLKKITHFPINYNLLLINDIKLFSHNLIEQREILNNASDKKYTFIVFYSQWASYYSTNTLKLLKKHLKYNSNNVLLIKVNTSPL